MYLCVDIGNSFIKVAALDGAHVVRVKGVFTINEALDLNKLKAESIKKIVISSVVSQKTNEVVSALHAQFGIAPLLIDTHINLNFQINMPKPEELGADLIANSAAAVARFTNFPTLVIDLGSANTFTIVDENHVFQGGLILPGLTTLYKSFCHKFPALTQYLNTKQLPAFYPNAMINNTTSGAVNAGLASTFYGPIVDNISKFKNQYSNLKVIVTGGDCELCQHIAGIDLITPDFTLQGIATLAELN